MTSEQRLAAAMRATVPPDLRPDPLLGKHAVELARRTRLRRWALVPAPAAAVLVASVLVVQPGASDREATRDPPPIVDLAAPDWSGCAARLPDVNPRFAEPMPDADSEVVAVAICGPVEFHEDWVRMDVNVSDSEVAQALSRAVAGAPTGATLDGCDPQSCDETWLAVRYADGSVARLVLTESFEEARSTITDGEIVRTVSEPLAAVIEDAEAAPEYTYSVKDRQPVYELDGWTCPDQVPWTDFERLRAAVGPGGAEDITAAFGRVVVCAYTPWEHYQGTVPLDGSVDLSGASAVELTSLVNSQDRVPQPTLCTDDAGYAYLVLLGAGDLRSHALFAEAYGCGLIGEVNQRHHPIEERLATRSVSRELEIRLRRLFDAL